MSRITSPSLETLSAFALGDLLESELGAVAEHLSASTVREEQVTRLDGMADAVISESRRLPNSGLHSDGRVTVLAGSAEPARPGACGGQVLGRVPECAGAGPRGGGAGLRGLILSGITRFRDGRDRRRTRRHTRSLVARPRSHACHRVQPGRDDRFAGRSTPGAPSRVCQAAPFPAGLRTVNYRRVGGKFRI
jgi:hypothetical protein